MPADYLIRLATPDDLPAINRIYNYYVAHSTCTYQTEPETAADRAAWFKAHGPGHPVTVAEAKGHVVAWGSLSRFHSRCAYQNTVEDSVYVDVAQHRRGLGTAILQDLIDRAMTLGHHAIIAGIDGEQEASVALHAKLQFKEVGHLREVGRKYDRWLDVIYMERLL